MLFVVAAFFAFAFAGLFGAALISDAYKCLFNRGAKWLDVGVDVALLFGVACMLWVSGQIIITNIFG